MLLVIRLLALSSTTVLLIVLARIITKMSVVLPWVAFKFTKANLYRPSNSSVLARVACGIDTLSSRGNAPNVQLVHCASYATTRVGRTMVRAAVADGIAQPGMHAPWPARPPHAEWKGYAMMKYSEKEHVGPAECLMVRGECSSCTR